METRTFYESYHEALSEVHLIESLKQTTRVSVLRDLLSCVSEDAIILIAGCGSKWDIMIPKHRFIAFDMSLSALRSACQIQKEGLYFIGDVANLPILDDTVDCIICSEVLEHIEHPSEAIREFRRVMRQDRMGCSSSQFPTG